MKALLLAGLLFGLQQEAAPKPPDAKDDILRQDIDGAIQKLGSEKYTESYLAREQLVEIGRRAVPAVVAELRKKDAKPAVKRALCEVLGAVRDPDKEAVAALVEKLKDTDEYGTSIAFAAASALGSIGDAGAAPALIEVLKSKAVDTDRMLKYACIRALGILRAQDAVDVLRKALEDRKNASLGEDDMAAHSIAAAAADALGLLRATEAEEDLCKMLPEAANDPASGQALGVHAARALQKILEPELRGKTGKDDPRAGSFLGEAKDVTAAHEAWKKWWDEKKTKKSLADTKERMNNIVAAIETFQKEQGKLPAVLEHLKKKPDDAKAFPEKGYTEGELKDGWGRPFDYRAPGTAGAAFDLVSPGKDGAAWGAGDDADLWNHDKWVEPKKEQTRKAIGEAVKAIQQFKDNQGRLPEKIHDLVVKPTGYPLAKPWPEKGYLVEVPKDGFDRPLVYRVPGTGGEPFDLLSWGADGAEGGAGADEDLWNHDKRPPKEEKKDEKK